MTNLWATTATFGYLNISNLSLTSLTVGYLNVTSTATITNLWATTATLSLLTVKTETVGYLNVTSTATMTNLWATTTTLSVLNVSGTASINNLNVTGPATFAISGIYSAGNIYTPLAIFSNTYIGFTSTATLAIDSAVATLELLSPTINLNSALISASTPLYTDATHNMTSTPPTTITLTNLSVTNLNVSTSATFNTAYSSGIYSTPTYLKAFGLTNFTSTATLNLNAGTASINVVGANISASTPIYTDSNKNLTSVAPTTVTLNNVVMTFANITGTASITNEIVSTATISNLTVVNTVTTANIYATNNVLFGASSAFLSQGTSNLSVLIAGTETVSALIATTATITSLNVTGPFPYTTSFSPYIGGTTATFGNAGGSYADYIKIGNLYFFMFFYSWNSKGAGSTASNLTAYLPATSTISTALTVAGASSSTGTNTQFTARTIAGTTVVNFYSTVMTTGVTTQVAVSVMPTTGQMYMSGWFST